MRLLKWVQGLLAFAVVLMLVVGALTIALISLSTANDTADCINHVLGARDQLIQADHENERQKILDQRKATKDQNAGLVRIPRASTIAEQHAAYRLYERGSEEFQQALDGWLARDKAIALQRQAHPLGRC